MTAIEGRPGRTGPSQANQGEGFSLTDVIVLLYSRRRLWIGLTVAAAALAVVVSLLIPPRYRSYVSFVPESTTQESSLIEGILPEQLANLGVDLSGSLGQNAPFYVDLLESWSVRRAVVITTYTLPDQDFSGNLIRHFRLDDVDPPPRALEKAVERLADQTSVARDPTSGMVTLSVESRSPELSRQIAERYHQELERFNNEQRSIRIREQVDFLQTQLSAAKKDLRAAEDSLESFLEQNRAYQQSPALTFRRDRLDRQVSIRVGIVNRLQQQLEQAQLGLLGQIPTVSIVDQPFTPQERFWPRRKVIVVAGTLLGLLAGLMLVFLQLGLRRVYSDLPKDMQSDLRKDDEDGGGPIRRTIHRALGLSGSG